MTTSFSWLFPIHRQIGDEKQEMGFDMSAHPLKILAMTRSSIELATKIYIVALSIVFIWSVTKVLAQIGWW